MAHFLLKQVATNVIYLFFFRRREEKIMKIEVKCSSEVIGILERLSIEWITTNKIENSLWVKGTAFFDRNYCRIAYYDEVHNILSIHKQ